jgi:heme o synthase
LCAQKIEVLKTSTSISASESSFSARLRDIAALFKLRLTLLVLVSSVLGYYMGTSDTNFQTLFALCLGGLLLTGGSNGMNQVFEREFDKLMVRTQNRPLPTGRMTVTEAAVVSSIAAIIGVVLLWTLINTASGVLGLSAFLLYAFVYTPMKRVSSFAVFIGAFPGAIPPMLGYVAATNDYGLEAGILFAIQFMWQFPHFWAIAWVAHEDYMRGGYKLLPFQEGQSKNSAFQILLYSLFLIPVSLLPWVFPTDVPMVGHLGAVVASIAGLVMVWYSLKLYRSCDVKDAKAVMFASFFYLPIVQLFYVIDKI